MPLSFTPRGLCLPCDPEDECCPVTLLGFCLADGTPIGLVVQEDEQIGWFDFQTGVFTPGPPPAGSGACPEVVATRPNDWAVSHAPAAAVQATASKAAEVGLRHVATAISFSVITTTTAPTTATLTVTLRDGATGAGTVLMVWRVRVSAAMTDINVAQVTLGGLNVAGSVNTAMTLEFDAGDINTLEDVSLTGYTVV